MAKIAVVGAGIFGLTIAGRLADKHTVDVFEKEKDIIQAASGINQFRLHRGYHYPRSDETARSCLAGIGSFKRDFADAIIDNLDHYYCIANKNSLTSSSDYLKFCKRTNLPYKKVVFPLVNGDEIALCVKVKEDIIDPAKLKKILLEKTRNRNIRLHLGTLATKDTLRNYDKVVICSYAKINELLNDKDKKNFQYEVCEKIVVELPKIFSKKSIVIMDGPFMCIDPYGSSDKFLLGNVVHAIHKTNIGRAPAVGNKYKDLLNRGIVKNPPITHFKKFIESGEKYIPQIGKAKYVGSMFTVRTVLPHKDKTDERPTVIRRIDKKTITVFSGKLVSSAFAADEVLKLLS